MKYFKEHLLSLVPINDGLKHRPRAEWSVIYMTCELGNAEIWLRSALHNDKPKEVSSERIMFLISIFFLLSLRGKYSFHRPCLFGRPLFYNFYLRLMNK